MSDYIRRVANAQPLHPRLAYLDIELTERCNNSCSHCSINLPAVDSGARARELSTERVTAILDEAAELGCSQVRLTGGEPLLRPDFEEIYLHARHLGLKVVIFTNARLISPHIADMLATVVPLVPVEVSVYGMHQASYEAVTGVRGSYEEFRRGVELLLDRGIPFVVKSALLPSNRAEIDEFEAWAREIPWMTEAPTYAMCFDVRARRDDADKNRRIVKLRLEPTEVVSVLARDPERYRADRTAFRRGFMGHPDDRLFACGAGHSVSVDAYGRAQPCLNLRAPSLSVDLAESSLSEALEHFTSLGDLRASDPEYLRRCARCMLKGFCDQCPAKSWAEYGTLDTPIEYLCQVAHEQARWLGWLGDEEYGWEVPPEPEGSNDDA